MGSLDSLLNVDIKSSRREIRVLSPVAHFAPSLLSLCLETINTKDSKFVNSTRGRTSKCRIECHCLSFFVCLCVGGGGVPFFLSHDGMYRSSPGRIKTFVNTIAKRPAIRRRPPFPSTTMTKRLMTPPRPLMNRCRFISMTKRSRNRAPTCRSATAAALEFT
jgi:hypothetical protein